MNCPLDLDHLVATYETIKIDKPKNQQCTYSKEQKGSTSVRPTVRFPISSLYHDYIVANAHVDQYNHRLSIINPPPWAINTSNYAISVDDPFIFILINLGTCHVQLYGAPGEKYKQCIEICNFPSLYQVSSMFQLSYILYIYQVEIT